jgi:hypothetical protein
MAGAGFESGLLPVSQYHRFPLENPIVSFSFVCNSL